jgi:hypothetical protein
MIGILAVRVVVWGVVIAAVFGLAIAGLFIYLVRRK